MTKIILAVFDGLQPAQINSVDTPNLFQISQNGAFFENHKKTLLYTAVESPVSKR